MSMDPSTVLTFFSVAFAVVLWRITKAPELIAISRAMRNNRAYGNIQIQSRRFALLATLRLVLWCGWIVLATATIAAAVVYITLAWEVNRKADGLDAMLIEVLNAKEETLGWWTILSSIWTLVATLIDMIFGSLLQSAISAIPTEQLHLRSSGWPESIPAQFADEPLEMWSRRLELISIPADEAGTFEHWRSDWPAWCQLVQAYRSYCLLRVAQISSD